jgi:ribonuclease Z
MIDALLLGTSGTIPLPGRPLSALLARVGPHLILFDCGEGTQVSMRRWGWGFKALSTICFSHLHADHVGGLPGLLHSIARAERTEPLDIYGPPGTQRVVESLRIIARYMPFDVRVHELAGADDVRWHDARLAATPVDHSVPCLAYRLDLKRARRFDAERARAVGAPVETWKALQKGTTIRVGNRRIGPSDVLGPARRGLRLAFATDTRPTPGLPTFIAGADLFVCEGTYGDPADAENAVANHHMLFSEAAEIARAASARRLWLTHFSAKMLDPEQYLNTATSIFPATTIGHEGLALTLSFDDEPVAASAASEPTATPDHRTRLHATATSDD